MAIIKIEYWNTCDFADILYQTDWKQRLYIDTEISRPEYPIEIETNKDGEGNDIPEFQRWQKRYKFKLVMPEFLTDALTLATLHDNIYITDKFGESAKVIVGSFLVSVNWVKDCYAECEIQFDVDYFVKSTCCNNLILADCYATTVDPVIDIISDADIIFTDPLKVGVQDGDRYIVTNSELTGNVGQIYFYSYKKRGEWVNSEAPAETLVLNLTYGEYYYFDGVSWQLWLKPTDVSCADGVITIKGFSLPNTFVKLYYKCATDDDFVLFAQILKASEFASDGFVLNLQQAGIDPCTCTKITYYLESYSHGCKYGTTKKVVAFTCGC